MSKVETFTKGADRVLQSVVVPAIALVGVARFTMTTLVEMR